MEKILEKKETRYVLGAIDGNYCYFLKINHIPVPGQFVAKKEYEMVTDIEIATKASTREIAEYMRKDYEAAIKTDRLEFSILPVVVEFSLIKETEDSDEI